MESEQTKAEESELTQKSTETAPKIVHVSPEELAAGEIPTASAHVVGNTDKTEQAQTPAAATEAAKGALSEIRDKDGKKFDPAKHATDGSGQPLLTPKGYFSRKKSGIGQRIKDGVDGLFSRKPVETATSDTSGASASAPSFREGSALPSFGIREPEPQKTESGGEALAAQTVAMEEMVAMMAFSEEWQFLDAERAQLVKVWAKHFEKSGLKEMPLWMEIAAAHAVIITTRIGKPKTQAKMGKIKGWLIKKFVDIRTGTKPEPLKASPRDTEAAK